MSHPLDQRIADFRLRVQWLVTIHGLSMVIAACLVVLIALGMADYLIRFQDRGIRVICWLGLIAALGWTSYRFLYLPRMFRLRDVDLAVRVQERFPSLGDRLVSAVEFLRQSESDPTAGSAALRRTVIAQATAETERLDFDRALDRRIPRRAAIGAMAIALAALGLVLLDPVASITAMTRLLDPFSETAWPRTSHLALRTPVERIARGKPFEIEVIDIRGANIPDDTRIHYRFAGEKGKFHEEIERVQSLGGRSIVRREHLAASFAFRIEGGDDRSGAWMPVEVIEPPAIRAIKIVLSPPEYTGWPIEIMDATASIRALAGTRIRIEGVATKPLKSAVIYLDAAHGVPAILSADGLTFATDRELVIEKSGMYWFELTDREGFDGGGENRWEIRAIADLRPSVAIVEPVANLFVTPHAVVPLRVVAKDDLAVHEASLMFSRENPADAKETSVVLYQGPAQASPRKESVAVGVESGDTREIRYRWDLEGLSLTPGAQVAFYATASDYLPQVGKSDLRKLVIITPDELQERIASRQNLLIAELVRVSKSERDARMQVRSLEIRVHETGGLAQADIDRLQAAELAQREVDRNLTSRSESVPMQIDSLLADMSNNRVDNPDFERRMQGLLDEIDRLRREPLPLAGRDLTAAIKTSQIRLQDTAHAAPDASTEAALARAGKSQDRVLASLDTMLDQLRQWDDYRRFHREVTQLLHDQEDLARSAGEAGRLTVTRDLKDLSPQEMADLKVLAERQYELARRLDRLEQEMEHSAADLRQTDPLAADTVLDAVNEARRLAIGASMHTAGAQLEVNRIGQVASEHKQILENIQEVLDILANSRRQELPRLVKKLQEAEGNLADLLHRQADLRKKIEQAGDQASPGAADSEQRKDELTQLSREQEALKEEADQLARHLERLLADKAAGTTHDASDKMGKAGDAASQGAQLTAAQEAKSAEEKLEDASHQLGSRRLQAQAELAMEQMARIEDEVKHLHFQQQKVADETRQFDATREVELTRTQMAGLHELARLQQLLEGETKRLSDSMVGAGGFRLVLSTARRDMGRAAALLERWQTGQPTQLAEQHAADRLALMLKSLEPEKPDAKKANGSGGANGQSNKGAQPGGVQALAELKVLKLMQEDLNLRTKSLQESIVGGTINEEQQEQLARLSEEQGQLATLMFELHAPATEESP